MDLRIKIWSVNKLQPVKINTYKEIDQDKLKAVHSDFVAIFSLAISGSKFTHGNSSKNNSFFMSIH